MRGHLFEQPRPGAARPDAPGRLWHPFSPGGRHASCDNSQVSSADQHGDADTRPSGSVPPTSQPAPDQAHADASAAPTAPAGSPVPIEPTETVVAEETLVVRRSPRYVSFMIVGAVLGALLALILTVAFPPNSQFDPGQVFGFLLLGGITVGVAVSCLVAIVLDRFVGRSATTVVVDRLDANSTRAFENPDPGSDPQHSNENS